MASLDRLFLVLMFTVAILMSIMFVNNIFIYKQKIKDFVSLMLISGIAAAVLEMLLIIVKDRPELNMYIHIIYCSYAISYLAYCALINRYLLDRMGVRFKKKRDIICFLTPLVICTLFAVTTQWTRLMFWVDESGYLRILFFNYIFFIVADIYIVAPMLLAVYYLTLGKHRRPVGGDIPASLFVFVGLSPVLYSLETMLLGEGMSTYETTSVPISLALLYLVTDISTHKVLDSQAKVKEVESDLRIASKIQIDALPDAAPEFAGHLAVNLRGGMRTAKEVGGDFFDYFAIDENRICFLIADVSGKGTPAALFMMTAKTMIKDYALTLGSTAEIFNAVNSRLCENNKAGMFATAWIGILDSRTMELQYTNAGHNYPVLQRKAQPCEELKDVHGLFLAGLEFTEYGQSVIKLNTGDRLFLYTDGVVEAHDRTKALYGMERLEKVLDNSRDCAGEQVLDRIFTDVSDFAVGMPQFDDITMVILTIVP